MTERTVKTKFYLCKKIKTHIKNNLHLEVDNSGNFNCIVYFKIVITTAFDLMTNHNGGSLYEQLISSDMKTGAFYDTAKPLALLKASLRKFELTLCITVII